MVAFAAVQDVADGWRPLSTDEQAVASTLLDRASNMVRLQVPGVDARAAADPVYSQTLTGIVAEMVTRVLKNPEAKKQESIDDYAWTRDSVVSAGLLMLTDGELAMLLPRTSGLGGAYVVSLGG